jgi:hypothetical protein
LTKLIDQMEMVGYIPISSFVNMLQLDL